MKKILENKRCKVCNSNSFVDINQDLCGGDCCLSEIMKELVIDDMIPKYKEGDCIIGFDKNTRKVEYLKILHITMNKHEYEYSDWTDRRRMAHGPIIRIKESDVIKKI